MGDLIDKSARIDLRTSEQNKQLLKMAAKLSGQTLTEFIMQVAVNQAQEQVQKAMTMSVDLLDYQQLMEVLEQPPQPSERLVQSLKSHPERGKSFGL
jgi:uncharacterized protein (DUF1778 family)